MAKIDRLPYENSDFRSNFILPSVYRERQNGPVPTYVYYGFVRLLHDYRLRRRDDVRTNRRVNIVQCGGAHSVAPKRPRRYTTTTANNDERFSAGCPSPCKHCVNANGHRAQPRSQDEDTATGFYGWYVRARARAAVVARDEWPRRALDAGNRVRPGRHAARH